MKRIYLLKLSVLLVFLTFKVSQAQSKKELELSNEYLKVANWKINNHNYPLLKWENKDTLRYEIIGKFQYMSKKNWVGFITDLELLTGIKIVETTNKSDAQIKIFFGELNDYFIETKNALPLNLDLKFNNWSNRNYNRQYQITNASYCIVPSKIQKEDHGNYYLKNLFLKSLGLLGVSDDDFSLFYKYPTDNNLNFKKGEKQIVKLHYNPNLKAGMDFQQQKNVLSQSIDLNALVKEKL
jgi:hypothetical protein